MSMDKEELKTGVEWMACDFSDTVIMDPDGWSRTDGGKSMNTELITLAEYQRRKMFCTLIPRSMA